MAGGRTVFFVWAATAACVVFSLLVHQLFLTTNEPTYQPPPHMHSRPTSSLFFSKDEPRHSKGHKFFEVEKPADRVTLDVAPPPRSGGRRLPGSYVAWTGDPGGWNGSCPFRDAGLTVERLKGEDPKKKPQDSAAKAANWEPPPWPPEIEAEFSNQSRYELPPGWISTVRKQGKQWYKITNFCVKDGRLTLFDPRLGKAKKENDSVGVKAKKFRLFNEFTTSRNPLRYNVEGIPYRLPGPLVDNPAWILSYWCQDLFHSTLTMMPGYTIKQHNNSDIYVRICGKSPCHVKLGSPLDWNDPYNPLWGGDTQFTKPGNPFWPMYRVITDQPYRIRPLYKHKYYNSRPRCYREGVVDKKWFILVTREEAIRYSDAHLKNFGIERVPRQCKREGGYRMTLINRQSRTRRLQNVQEVAELAACHGFNVTVVAFETIPIKRQIEIAANTDLLLGLHGNALIWTMFQERGAYEIELAGIWYERYAKLWGNGYNQTTTYDKRGVKYNEYTPLSPNMTQVEIALRRAKEHLDRTSCGERELPSLSETHKQVWEEIVIRFHPELAKKGKRGQTAKPTEKAVKGDTDTDSSAKGSDSDSGV